MTTLRFAIRDTFAIAGRGVVVVIDETTSLPAGRALPVAIIRPDGSRIATEAFKELLCRREPTPTESYAYLVHGVSKADVPQGSAIEFETS